METNYLTLKEVENLTHISVFSLRKKIRAKELKASKTCNRYLVSKADLEEFIAKGKNY